MCNISDTTRPVSHGETSWETGDTATPNSRNEQRQAIIKDADSVPLPLIFKFYNLRIDDQNNKVKCPFKHHNGGKERTPSMVYYPATNSFWCFGCHTGRGTSDFVANMDGTNKFKAALKIIDIFHEDIESGNVETDDFAERLDLMISFSNMIREFRNTHFTKESYDYIENICKIYDSLILKKGINNESLKHINEKIQPAIVKYK